MYLFDTIIFLPLDLHHVAYKGAKILLFGGDTDGVPAMSVGTLDILDVQTMKWSISTDCFEERSKVACSVSGDNFIVWGGTFCSHIFHPFSSKRCDQHKRFLTLDC
jgi:hypothetical protein